MKDCCEVCELPLDGHLGCDACTIFLGEGHFSLFKDYRNKTLCVSCIHRWKKLEEKKGKSISFLDMIHSSPRYN